MIQRIKVFFEEPELKALYKLCDLELRNPMDQIRKIVRQELIRQGLLTTDLHIWSEEEQASENSSARSW